MEREFRLFRKKGMDWRMIENEESLTFPIPEEEGPDPER